MNEKTLFALERKGIFSFNTAKLGDGIGGTCIRVLKRNRTSKTYIYIERKIYFKGIGLCDCETGKSEISEAGL